METLIKLRKELNYAQMAFQACQATNVYNLTPEKRVELDIASDLASRAYFQAEMAYRSALREFEVEKAT